MKLMVIGLCIVAVAVALTFWIGRIRQDRTTKRLAGQLIQQGSTAKAVGLVSFTALEELPLPVARYLRHVLRNGQPLIRTGRFTQTGELRTDDTTDRWYTFDARQIVTPLSPGFTWEARVRLAPSLHVSVRDAYIGGQGMGQVSLMSAITISREEGGSVLNAGELYRYLAEAVWYPTALLPSASVQWTPIDTRRALATLTNAGITVTVEFRFSEADEVSSIYVTGRGRRVGNGYQITPWEGRVRQYAERSGILVPTEGEVGWHVLGEWRPVWRGRMLAVAYEFAGS